LLQAREFQWTVTLRGKSPAAGITPCRWPSALAYLLRAFGSHLAHERNSASRTTWPTRARPASVFGPVHLSRAAYAPVPRRLARLAGRPAVGTLSSGARACRSRQYEAASAAFTFSASGMGSSRMRRPERDGNGGRSRAHARVHAVGKCDHRPAVLPCLRGTQTDFE
jgi:hypothetical protein